MTRYIYTTPKVDLLPPSLHDAVYNEDFAKSPLSTVALADGVLIDIAECPHLLVAGTTGSGKSVVMHNMIASLLLRNTPSTAEFIIIDPKRIEFKPFYSDLPLLRRPIITDIAEANSALSDIRQEMERRYMDMETRHKRKWDGKKLYVFIDEVAELVFQGRKKVQDLIANIAFLGRASGIHLIVAVQHPTADIISRNITANITTRICLKVDKWSESQLILGVSGAEKLRGRGDAMLLKDGEIQRFQGAYLDDDSLESFSHSWKVEEKAPSFTVTMAFNS
jgi:S-DNA-T family DNA segregation ATPase FtsK/SpoIIIE